MKIAFAAAFAGAILLASPASAVTLVQYDFTGATGNQASTAASNVAAGLTGLAFTRGAGLTAVAGAGSINSSGWSLAANDYYSFGLNVVSGFTASIDQLVLSSRSSGTGPGSINLLAAIDGGTFSTLATFAQIGTADSQLAFTFAPLIAANSVEFRLVAANTTSANGGTIATGGTYRVQNYTSPAGATGPVAISGTVAAVSAAVPEPATWAMMIVGFGLVAAGMRRRQAVNFRFA